MVTQLENSSFLIELNLRGGMYLPYVLLQMFSNNASCLLVKEDGDQICISKTVPLLF